MSAGRPAGRSLSLSAQHGAHLEAGGGGGTEECVELRGDSGNKRQNLLRPFNGVGATVGATVCGSARVSRCVGALFGLCLDLASRSQQEVGWTCCGVAEVIWRQVPSNVCPPAGVDRVETPQWQLGGMGRTGQRWRIGAGRLWL